MENIMELFGRLEDTVDDATKVPFTENVMVNGKELLDLIMDIKLKFPDAIKHAEWVIQERNKILMDARKEAEGKLKESERYANRLVDENEVTRRAYEQAEKIVESAKQAEREMKLGALEYADSILVKVEEGLKQTMERFHEQFLSIEETYSVFLQQISKNRQELRGINRNNIDDL